MDWFCGAGGSSQGLHAIPGVHVARAANHWERAVETHASNFPTTDHYLGDIREAPVHRWPICDLFWASPECPQWSSARGKRRDYDNQPTLPGLEPERDEAADRSRALMDEVPQYLSGVAARGGRVLAGVVENVVEVRAWSEWSRWLDDIRRLGYDTRLIALNSMHAHAVATPRAPQSRDRLYLAYWHRSLGRAPDWDKWLRPAANCDSHGRVDALQVFKRRGADMGRYRASYVYRCPHRGCRPVEPEVIPASAVIDPSLSALRIGDRARPLAAATMRRICAGAERYWQTSRGAPSPLMVPLEGRDGKHARPATLPHRTQTARNETGIAQAPDLLVPYYGASSASPATTPVGTLTTRDRYGLAQPAIEIEDVRFRMLSPAEIGRGMAFSGDYIVTGSKREQVRQYGNAVTPPVAELLGSALIEAITGDDLPRGDTP